MYRLTNGHNELIIANRNGRRVVSTKAVAQWVVSLQGWWYASTRLRRCSGWYDCCKHAETKETVMVLYRRCYGENVQSWKTTTYKPWRWRVQLNSEHNRKDWEKVVAIKNITDENDLMIINQSGIVNPSLQ